MQNPLLDGDLSSLMCKSENNAEAEVVTGIQLEMLKRVIAAKARRVDLAFRKWQAMPEKRDKTIYLKTVKAIRFEQGLKNFAERTLRNAYRSFKEELENTKKIKGSKTARS
jgi:hypothetical protein